jgi:hypothetical protein
VGPENFFSFFGGFMPVGKGVNNTMQGDTLLNPLRVIKLFFSFYKVADKVAYQYFRRIEGKICMGEVVNRLIS